MNLIDCDYIEDYEGNFYIVKGYWNKDFVLCNKVFSPDENGGRYNKETGKKYSKVINNNFELSKVSHCNIKRIFKPAECLKAKISELNSKWKELVDYLIETGIPENKIGIFGSQLIGFEMVKDYDFVVYGKENCRSLIEKIEGLKSKLKITGITKEHINYQTEKYGKFHSPKYNSFEKMLKNKWSSLQFGKGILSTIRFVYGEDEIPENPFKYSIKYETESEGIVIDDFETNFCPRSFLIKTNSGIKKVSTYYWAYQSCVKKGMKVKIKANERENRTLTIDSPNQGVKIL
ncbi:MAG: hypothetical protein PHW96_05015 [Candidatus Nanoarchaeia archaeon]|nr:hypothetical protein [Candidatus Nanoarchaeia archaeon]